jgi:hypothetical protein
LLRSLRRESCVTPCVSVRCARPTPMRRRVLRSMPRLMPTWLPRYEPRHPLCMPPTNRRFSSTWMSDGLSDAMCCFNHGAAAWGRARESEADYVSPVVASMSCSPNPAALQIDPPPGSGNFASMILRPENCFAKMLADAPLLTLGSWRVRRLNREDVSGNVDTLHCASPLFENRWRQIRSPHCNTDTGKLQNSVVRLAGCSWEGRV